MSGKERLPEERWRRAGMSGSLNGRRSEEMAQSITFHEVESTFRVPEEVIAIQVPQNEEMSGGGRNGGRKGVGSAIRCRRANRESINIPLI